jgi:hypothetical protein
MMDRQGQSDSSVRPGKSPNKAGKPVAEGTEERELAKGNSRQSTALRTQGRARVARGLERIRQAAKRDKGGEIYRRAVVAVLNAIYETEFLGFSYGFRPKRSQHDALDAVDRAPMTRKVAWVLDADLGGFFESISHAWLVKFVEHRIGGRRIVRRIQQWLRAGVLEDGSWTQQEAGDATGWECLTLTRQPVPPLCVRPVGPAVAEEDGARRGDRRALG